MKKYNIFLMALLIILIFNNVLAENVCLEDIVYQLDGKIKITIKNYENQSANGKIFLNFVCDTLNYSVSDNLTLIANEKKEITYAIKFCTCNVSASLKFEKNINKRIFLSKNFESIKVKFYSLTTYIEGEMNVESKFSVFDNEKIYEGKTKNGRFSFKLPNIGNFSMKIDYCNKTINFSTKHKINVYYENAEEGKNLTLYLKDENNNPLKDIMIYKYNNSKIPIGKTNIYGFIRIIPNETFKIIIDESPYNYNFSEIIYVKQKPSIEIHTIPEENFTIGEIYINAAYNNSIIPNVLIEVEDPENNIAKFITDDTIKYFAKIPGIYKISAKKENFKDSVKQIIVYGRIYVNFSAEKFDVNDSVKVKVYKDEYNEKEKNFKKIPLSNAIVEIKTENLTKIDMTDIDGEIKFKVPDVNKFNVCVKKEYYLQVCKEINVERELNFKLSENYISENRYIAFENLTIIPYSKGVPIILDEVVVIADKNFTIYPKFAKFTIPLNFTGKYEIYGYKEGYANAYIKIFVEKRDIYSYIYIKDNFLIINFSETLNENANEIFIKNLDKNETKKVKINKSAKIDINEMKDGNYEISIPIQYDPKFYINNILINSNKFRIEKSYDYSWISIAIIMILLLSTLVIVQEKYKKS